jgi:plastocyanin
MTKGLGNRTAIVALIAILVGIPLAIVGYQYGLRPVFADHRIIDITARVPENGGFQPDLVRMEVGETVTLRFAADDVVHGIAIGPGLGVDIGQVDPGHVGEMTLTVDSPGIYTYYCNTWCSPSHWRMRGVLEVVDPDAASPASSPPDPIIETLVAAGIDIDADPQTVDGIAPDHGRGQANLESVEVPAELFEPDWRLQHTPEGGLGLLRAANRDMPDDLLIDVVAFLWSKTVPTEQAVELFAKNCAACHGERGGGDGPVAESTIDPPVAFAEAAWLRRGDIWYAKIRRGGMGTDMPNFGTLFTVAETRSLVDYLWFLSFAGP